MNQIASYEDLPKLRKALQAEHELHGDSAEEPLSE
jgi:hypothetical protein